MYTQLICLTFWKNFNASIGWKFPIKSSLLLKELSKTHCTHLHMFYTHIVKCVSNFSCLESWTTDDIQVWWQWWRWIQELVSGCSITIQPWLNYIFLFLSGLNYAWWVIGIGPPVFIITQNRVIIICNCYVGYQNTETKEKHTYLRSKWWAASWMRMMLILSLDDCNTCRTAARQHTL